MSRTGIKMAVARAIVDREFRRAFVGAGADMRAAVDKAGYPITDQELAMLSCNTEDSFDERFVTIDNWDDLWRLSEDRINKALSGRRAEAGPLPQPGTPAALAEGL
jgi:hypothetical protein